jgi:hypothetical protein
VTTQSLTRYEDGGLEINGALVGGDGLDDGDFKGEGWVRDVDWHVGGDGGVASGSS